MLELWSLFDFLMPGYLGNEKQFNAKFSKPILLSRDPKSSPKEQESGNCTHFTEQRGSFFFLLVVFSH